MPGANYISNNGSDYDLNLPSPEHQFFGRRPGTNPPVGPCGVKVTVPGWVGPTPGAGWEQPSYDDSAWTTASLNMYSENYHGSPSFWTAGSWGYEVPTGVGDIQGNWYWRGWVNFPTSATLVTIVQSTGAVHSFTALPGECLYWMDAWGDNSGQFYIDGTSWFAINPGGSPNVYESQFVVSVAPGLHLIAEHKQGDASFDGAGCAIYKFGAIATSAWSIGISW